MLSALLVALREGVEAALVVGIVLVYLNRTGRRALARYAWAGVGAACVASVAAAILLQKWAVSEDGFEGVLMLVAAALVVTMIVWMNRVARTLKKEIEQRVEAYAQRSTGAAGWGIGAFRFSDGVARRCGACVDSARGGTFQRGRASVDWDGIGHCDCGRGGPFLFSRDAANSTAPVFLRHQRDPDGRRFPAYA